MWEWIVNKLSCKLRSKYKYRTPNLRLTNLEGDPYMIRFYVIPRNRFLNIYLHQFVGDDTRAFHNHPWFSIGLILKGSYVEVTPISQPKYWSNVLKQGFKKEIHPTGKITFRSPKFAHYIELDKYQSVVWSLFITGPKMKDWGFYDDPEKGGRWIPHVEYINKFHENSNQYREIY